MDHRVLRVFGRRPFGVYCGAFGDFCKIRSLAQRLIQVPASEGVACLCRYSWCGGRGTGTVEFRRDIRSAVGLAGDPEALFHFRVQVDVLFCEGDAAGILAQRRVGVPAGDGFIGAYCKGHVRGAHGRPREPFLGADDAGA